MGKREREREREAVRSKSEQGRILSLQFRLKATKVDLNITQLL
jgi:hypothetical protein